MQFQLNCQYFSSQSKGPKTSDAHSKPLTEIRAKQDCYYWSFFLRSIRQWNNLPINRSDLLEIQFNNGVKVSGDVGEFS